MDTAPPVLRRPRGRRAPHRDPSLAMVLVIACAAQSMVVLDVSIVNVALPDMKASLGLGPAGQQWIVNAYTLTFAGLLLLGGRAADLVGARRAFLAGLGTFTAASLVCGLATDGGLLAAARAAQGVGGAILAPAGLTLIMTTFTEPRARTRAMGAWSAVIAAGGAAGAVLGGVLTEYAGWRWVFFVNVPLGAAVLVAAVLYVPAARAHPGGPRRLDLPGALTVTAGLTALVYGIITAETRSWSSPRVVAALAAGVLLIAAFLAVEARVAAPLVPLAVLRRRTLALANLVVTFLGGAMFSMWFLLSLSLQQVLGFSALGTGMAFLPGCVAIVLGARVATRLIHRSGPRPLLVTGMALSTAGFAGLSRLSAGGSYAADLLGPFALCTLGFGLALLPVTAAATAGTAHGEAGLASGLVNTSRQVGGALGLAVLAIIATRTTGAHPGPAAAALAAGYGRAFLYAGLFTACAALASLFLPGSPPGRDR